MEWVETTGRTLEEAKEAALDQLGVDEQDAEFEVLEEARVGLFGRVRSEARVRARVRPTRPRPKLGPRDRRRRQPKSEDAGAARPGRQPRDVDRPAPAGENGEDMDDEPVPLAEQAELGRAFVEGLLSAFGVSGSAAVREVDEETMEITVSGDELGLLIGAKGATLNALQEVTRTVVQRRTAGREGRIVVDVSSYRQKRREALERFTQEVAAQVRESGSRRVLEPMSAADRKVVHDTVNELEGIRTTSEGEEPRRRVVILPEG